MTRPQHVESPDDAPVKGARWNPAAWSNEGRWELDGTPVSVPAEVVEALSWFGQGGLPHRGHVAALAARVAELEGEVARLRTDAIDAVMDAFDFALKNKASK